MSGRRVSVYTSIQFRVIIITIAVITLVLGCFAAVDIALKHTRMQQELSRSTEIIAQRLSNNLKLPLWDLNQESTHETLVAELQVPDVYAIAVYEYGKYGRKLFSGIQRNADWEIVDFAGVTSAGLIKRVSRIDNNGEELGRVEVYLSPRIKNAELLRSVRNVAIALVLVDLCIFAVLWLVLRAMLINPITYLSEVAEKISLGQFKQDLRYDKRRDEIGLIAKAIGRMEVSLGMAIRRLHQTPGAAKSTPSA